MGLAVHAAYSANTSILIPSVHFCRSTVAHLRSHFVDTVINSVFRKTSGENRSSERIAGCHRAQGLGSRVNLSALAAKSKFNQLPHSWMQSLPGKSKIVQPLCHSVWSRVQVLP